MLGIAHENQAKSNRYLYKLDERKAPTGGDELLGGSKGLREKIEPIKGYILKNKLYTDIEETEEGHDEQENARG
jgi:hypothetical protein